MNVAPSAGPGPACPVVAAVGADRTDGSRRRAVEASRFAEASAAARVLVAASVLAALTVPAFLTTRPPWRSAELPSAAPPWALALIFVASSVVSVELGRVLERRLVVGQRPHKALSTWALAAATTAAPLWLLVVVPITYAHAYWRGMRPPVWKWVGSAAFVVLAGVAAQVSVRGCTHRQLADSPAGLGALLAGVAAFLATESLLFAAVSRVNHAEQEGWLRATLAGPAFYLTEAAMLCVGALSAATWTHSPWYATLLLPVYLLAQQAALFDQLRGEAEHDDKTGLLRYEAWRRASTAAVEHLDHAARGWAVLMLDLDRFTDVNTQYGHLVADEVLVQVGRLLPAQLRCEDLVCRFGGEEFAVLLVHVDHDTALALAERLRESIAHGTVPAVTTSVGLAAFRSRPETNPGLPQERLRTALAEADRALREAKTAGRNRVTTSRAPARLPAA